MRTPPKEWWSYPPDKAPASPLGAAHDAVLLVGRRRGAKMAKAHVRCNAHWFPELFTHRSAVECAQRIVAEQLGMGITATKAIGAWGGKVEPSTQILVANVGLSATEFNRRVKRVAEQLAHNFCQDSVLVQVLQPTSHGVSKQGFFVHARHGKAHTRSRNPCPVTPVAQSKVWSERSQNT